MESNRLTLLYNVSTGTIQAEDGINNLYLHSVLVNELVVKPNTVFQTNQLVYCTFAHYASGATSPDLTLKPILLAVREATSTNSTTTVVDSDSETTSNEYETGYEYYTQIPQAVLVNVGSWKLSFAVKEYSTIPTGTLTYCGDWNANGATSQVARTPQTGDYYICSTQGQYNPQGTSTTGITTWKVGDIARYSGSAWARFTSLQIATSGLFSFTVAQSLGASASTPTDYDIYVVWEQSKTAASNAEAWAVGQRNGVDVESTDTTYHNNSKYYSQQASASATSASNSATSASASADDAETYADLAEEYKDDAETAATSAQTSATTATTKASEASASATTATTKAASASTDATRAETAADRAEAAMNDKLDKKPDGTNLLIDSNNKINITYIPDSILGQLEYKGTFNATTGASITPQKNWYYICATAGSKNPDGTSTSISYEVGDWSIYSGTEWQKVDNTDAVRMVNSQIGNVETYKGAFSLNEQYFKGDILVNNGVLYICIQTSTGNAITNTTYFTPLVTLDALAGLFEGSDYIVVEENEAGTKMAVELDQTNLETSTPTSGSSKLITSGAVYNGKELFVCTYGITTFAEITTAISNGKIPVLYYNRKQYWFSNVSLNAQTQEVDLYVFSVLTNNINNACSISASNSWSAYTNAMQPELTWDSTPTSGSSNAISSGAVYNAIVATINGNY